MRWPMVPLREVLSQSGVPEWIDQPQNEMFVTLRLNARGAVRRTIGDGKTPKPFRGVRVSKGQFIYSRIDARNGAFALVGEELDRAVVSKDFPVFGINPRVDPGYLMRMVSAPGFYSRIGQLSFGATNRQRVGESSLLALSIPLPPLPEQRRIASILDELQALRQRRADALDRLSMLSLDLFEFSFGTPDASSWPVGTVADLIRSANYGTSAKAGASGDHAVLRMGNLTTTGALDLTELKRIDIASKDLDKYLVHTDDVLFNRTNSVELVGKSARYSRSEPMAYAGYLVRLRPKPGYSGHYLAGFLNSRWAKARLRGMAKSIVGMANINAKEVQSIPVPIPSAEAQAEYAATCELVESARKVGIAHLSKLDELFAALQHRAFRGEL